MLDAIRSEFRKLVTIRSTYIFMGIITLFVIFMTFYIEGVRGGNAIALNRDYLAHQSIQAVGAMGMLAAIVGLLILSHEYRHNLITYTLTAAKSRTQVLLAKILVVSGFAIVFALFLATLAPLMTYLGAVVVKGVTAAPQMFDVWGVAWRVALTGWGYAMIALIFAALIRNQVGAVSAFLFTPVTVEPLLSLLLKENAIYLPYTVITQVLDPRMMGGVEHVLSSGKAALFLLLYVAIGWLVTWFLFVRRDAN